MTALREPQVRGACPGALEPMESGDGLIVRVRPHAGALSVAALARIADAAAEFGNGAIDLTRRANLQMRGLSQATLAPVRDVLSGLGVLDESAAAERRRNIMLSPLAGIDENAPGFTHARTLALELEAALANAPELQNLSAKFGFVIDDGGELLALRNEASDIRLRFVSQDRVAIGLDMTDRTHWLGDADASNAMRCALKAAAEFLTLTHGTAAKRLRDATQGTAERIRAALGLAPIASAPLAALGSTQRLGIVAGLAVSLGAPFGRVEAADLSEFASSVEDLGIKEVRLSPWRSLVVPITSEEQASHVLAAGLAHGFIASDEDPLTRIDACTGAPACPCGAADTRTAARRLAALWPTLALKSAHVSGCTKGCARSSPADLVLVGRGDHFSIIRKARADGRATSTIPLTLDGLADALGPKES